MEGTCIGKGIVIGINLTSGLFRYKARGSYVYNETAEKRVSFCSFIVCDNTCKVMR